MRATIQNILNTAWDDHHRRHRQPEYIHKAVAAMRWCRTAVLGGHVKKCPAGHVAGVWYTCCGHRACPQCAWGKIEKWLAAKKALILPCDHYHVTFTVPDSLRVLWMWNKKRFADLLFQQVRATLFDMLGGPRRLGEARPGFLATLHTWGRTLIAHPHIHCLVIGGGLMLDGQWKNLRKRGYLLPVRQVAKEFRDRFCAALTRLLEQGALELPPDLSRTEALRLVRRLQRRKWNVNIPPAYEHGRGVATYLARYMVGGPIKNHRLRHFDTHNVTFSYGDHRTKKEQLLTLAIAEFLRRLLLHVPLPGMRVVRSYGLYHHTHRKELEQARELLGGGQLCEDDREDEGAEGGGRAEVPEPPRCPVCQRELIRTSELQCGGWEVPRWAPSGVPPPHATLQRIG